MQPLEKQLAQLVVEFRAWLAANYAPQDIAALHVDNAGYPGWPQVTKAVGELLRAGQLPHLSYVAQCNLLYLIARNWDIGSLLNWLYSEPALSNVGPLSEADFLRLACTVAHLSHPEYDDAKSQFAACFRKLPALTAEGQEVLLALFGATGHEYTQQQALRSLAHLGYPGLRELLPLAWETSADEHHKLAVLAVIADYLPDPVLLRHYLALADAVPGAYLAGYVRDLRHALAHPNS